MNNKTKDILQKIKNNEISARSKSYFQLQSLLIIVISFLTILVSIYFLSFILFDLRVTSFVLVVGRGPHGFLLFFRLFPWKLFLLDVLLISFLGWILRVFRFGYRIPALYLLLTVFIVIVGASIIVDRTTNFHNSILEHSRHHELPPPFKKMYERVRHSSKMSNVEKK